MLSCIAEPDLKRIYKILLKCIVLFFLFFSFLWCFKDFFSALYLHQCHCKFFILSLPVACAYILMCFFLLFTVLSLQELCCRAIVARTTVYSIEQLPLPISLKSCLKSYSMTTYKSRPHIPTTRDKSLKKTKQLHHPCDSLTSQCRKSCTIS